MVNLAVSLGKLNLKKSSDFGLSTCGYGREISSYLDLNKRQGNNSEGFKLLPFFENHSSSITRSIRWNSSIPLV